MPPLRVPHLQAVAIEISLGLHDLFIGQCHGNKSSLIQSVLACELKIKSCSRGLGNKAVSAGLQSGAWTLLFAKGCCCPDRAQGEDLGHLGSFCTILGKAVGLNCTACNMGMDAWAGLR